MATKVLNFENNRIAFDINADENVMVNATEMAKIFEKTYLAFCVLTVQKHTFKPTVRPQICGLKMNFHLKGN